jgi:uncharacterized membrane protein
MPAHIDQTVRAIAKLHADHHSRATPLQRMVEKMTNLASHPWFIGAVTFAVATWIGGNLLLEHYVGMRIDGRAFPWLQGVGQLTAIYITTLVLVSQRRKDELSELREQLTLELALMTEQKSAKTIALLEELRRDHPQIGDRIDRQAEAMAEPADPHAVLDAFQETKDDMIAEASPPGNDDDGDNRQIVRSNP